MECRIVACRACGETGRTIVLVNPTVNLKNAEGLPAFPFMTDDARPARVPLPEPLARIIHVGRTEDD